MDPFLLFVDWVVKKTFTSYLFVLRQLFITKEYFFVNRILLV